MNPACGMCGWTKPSPARFPIERAPAMGGAAIKALPVLASQDRALVAFTDSEVNRAGRARHQRDDGGLVALSDDVQSPMATQEAEVLDVGGARLATLS
jgi:hypothetical protein